MIVEIAVFYHHSLEPLEATDKQTYTLMPQTYNTTLFISQGFKITSTDPDILKTPYLIQL